MGALGKVLTYFREKKYPFKTRADKKPLALAQSGSLPEFIDDIQNNVVEPEDTHYVERRRLLSIWDGVRPWRPGPIEDQVPAFD